MVVAKQNLKILTESQLILNAKHSRQCMTLNISFVKGFIDLKLIRSNMLYSMIICCLHGSVLQHIVLVYEYLCF